MVSHLSIYRTPLKSLCHLVGGFLAALRNDRIFVGDGACDIPQAGIVRLRDVDKHRPLRDCAGGDVGDVALSAPRADVGIRPYVICGSSKRLPYEGEARKG